MLSSLGCLQRILRPNEPVKVNCKSFFKNWASTNFLLVPDVLREGLKLGFSPPFERFRNVKFGVAEARLWDRDLPCAMGVISDRAGRCAEGSGLTKASHLQNVDRLLEAR